MVSVRFPLFVHRVKTNPLFELTSSSSFFECFHSKLLQLSNCFASRCVLVSPLDFEPLWPLHAVQSSNIQESVWLSTHWQSFARVTISPLINKRLPTMNENHIVSAISLVTPGIYESMLTSGLQSQNVPTHLVQLTYLPDLPVSF